MLLKLSHSNRQDSDLSNNRLTQAVIVLQQAVRSYQQQGNTIGQAIALSNVALTYHQLGDWTQAIAGG